MGLGVSNNGDSIFATLFAEYGFCAPDDSGEIYAQAVFDYGNVHDLILTFQDGPGGAHLHFPYENKWIDLISRSENLYIRLFLCAMHVDLEFDVSGPVTIPEPEGSGRW